MTLLGGLLLAGLVGILAYYILITKKVLKLKFYGALGAVSFSLNINRFFAHIIRQYQV